MIVLSLDPGLRASGLALFVNGQLVAAEVVTQTPRGKTANRACDSSEMACRCVVAVAGMMRELGGAGQVDRLLCEWPQIYQRSAGRSKGDPNDLLPLAGVCAAICALLSPHGPEVISLNPAEWKGQVDGDVMTARILAKLGEAERAILPRGALAHNAIDAAGLGLFHLGRLQRARAVSR